MKRPFDDSASAPASLNYDSVSPLQNQLLIELLKKNIDATSRASSQDRPVYFEPSSLDIGTTDAGTIQTMASVCRNIERMISSLQSVSQNLSQSIMAKQSIGLNANQVHAFLERIEHLKHDMGSIKNNNDASLFDRAKENVNSIVGYLVKDKKRADSMNEEYVDKICAMRISIEDAQSQLKLCLNLVSAAKEIIGSLAAPKLELDYLRRKVTQQLEHYNTCTLAHLEGFHFDFPVEEFESLDHALTRMNSTLWRVVCAVKQQKLKNRNLRSENIQLSQQLEDTRSLLNSQQQILLEQSKRYEEEIARLQEELDAAKARDQTTPPTSATRKRRVLVDTVIAFTGLSRDPDRLQELTDIASKVLNCKVHLSADFTSDITHVVCPSGYQSVRTMAAALSSKWIMSTEWLTESAKAGKLLPENTFGQLHLNGPSTLRSKTFHLTPAFIAQQASHQMNAVCCKTLIEPIGKGRVIDDVETSDHVLCGDREERRSRRWIRLKDFIRMIPGHNT